MAVEYRRHPQHPLELRQIREWVKDAESICEIGSRFGDNLVFLAVSMRGNRLVSVDLPGAEGGVDADVVRIELKNNVKKLRDAGFDVDLILGDSHSREVWAQVKASMPAKPNDLQAALDLFDVMFIDGDHSYEGVKQDWLTYGRMAKTVIFHDIKEGNGLGVSQLWKELEGDKDEYIAPGSKMGVGCIWNTG